MFKPIKQQKEELEARERMPEEERKELELDDFWRSLIRDMRWEVENKTAGMNINEILDEAALVGKVEFGIKPNSSDLLDIFDLYTKMLDLGTRVLVHSRKDDRLIIPPAFALAILMKTVLKEIDAIDRAHYPFIAALPWGEYIGLIGNKIAEDYLKAALQPPASTVLSKLSNSEIPDYFRDYLLHCSILMNGRRCPIDRVTVCNIAEWALAKSIIVRDL